jgi:hypothetical protein
MGNSEPIRSVAIGLDGSFVRVFLDPVLGQYGRLRRVRDPEPSSDAVQDAPTEEAAQNWVFTRYLPIRDSAMFGEAVRPGTCYLDEQNRD